MILIAFFAMMAQAEPLERVKCSSGKGPIHIDPTGKTTVLMKCCPPGFYIENPDRPMNEKGDLVCAREV